MRGVMKLIAKLKVRMSDLPESLIGLLEKPECSGGIADIAWLLEMYLSGEFDNRSIEERAAI
jgi:hypothetical protein